MSPSIEDKAAETSQFTVIFSHSSRAPIQSRGWRWLLLPISAILAWIVVTSQTTFPTRIPYATEETNESWISTPSNTRCQQESPLEANSTIARTLLNRYRSENFTIRAANALGGAVRVKTEVFDGWGSVAVDPRWAIFSDFHDYLEETFPKVHDQLSLTKVNEWGLLYKWQGSDPTLTPILFMAHQDVVPVDPTTTDKWTYPPYSGAHEDGYVWGRGSCDDKSSLIAILLSIENLLDLGFIPQRTVVLSFGFDEEVGGHQGALELAKYLKENGPDRFGMIIDEGGGMAEMYGRAFALPAIAEKGYVDVRVQVNTPGGHSSNPPTHTSIGYLSLMIGELESHAWEPILQRSHPLFQSLVCEAIHAPNFPRALRKDTLLAADGSDPALKRVNKALLDEDIHLDPRLEARRREIRSILSTTQAVDIISGGIKVNALPEESFALVNYRIAVESSVLEVQQHIESILRPIATKYGLEFLGFFEVARSLADSSGVSGRIKLSEAFQSAFKPAPISQTDSSAYRLLSSTIRGTWRGSRDGGTDIIVAPAIINGNTDTKFYWELSDNIFRYSHVGLWHRHNGVHTVNEALRVDGLVELVAFYTNLILNTDQSKDL